MASKLHDQLLVAEDVATTTRPVFNKWKWEQEVMLVLLLDAQHKLIGKPQVVAVGTVTGVGTHPRDIFREAIRRNAVAIIVAHCHPSGNLQQSHDDEELTKRLLYAGRLLGIQLLDHVIVARKGLRSLAETTTILQDYPCNSPQLGREDTTCKNPTSTPRCQI